jgi:hypothetical protein
VQLTESRIIGVAGARASDQKYSLAKLIDELALPSRELGVVLVMPSAFCGFKSTMSWNLTGRSIR